MYRIHFLNKDNYEYHRVWDDSLSMGKVTEAFSYSFNVSHSSPGGQDFFLNYLGWIIFKRFRYVFIDSEHM